MLSGTLMLYARCDTCTSLCCLTRAGVAWMYAASAERRKRIGRFSCSALPLPHDAFELGLVYGTAYVDPSPILASRFALDFVESVCGGWAHARR